MRSVVVCDISKNELNKARFFQIDVEVKQYFDVEEMN